MKKSEKLRGSELLALLPEDVQQKYVDNMLNLDEADRADDILEMRESRFTNLVDFLAQSFDWEKSAEGRDFWEGVLNAKYDNKDLDQGIDEINERKAEALKGILEGALSKLAKLMLGSDEDNIDAMRMEEPSTGKTGNQYLEYLTPKERDEYMENAKKFTTEGMIESNLSRKHSSFKSFLCGSFPFLITPQGQSYWSDICEREIAEDLNEVLSELKINTANGEV